MSLKSPKIKQHVIWKMWQWISIGFRSLPVPSPCTFRLKDQKLITNCKCLAKLHFKLIFPVLPFKTQVLLWINLAPCSTLHSSLRCNWQARCHLLMWESAQGLSGCEVNWISKDKSHQFGADLFTSWLMKAIDHHTGIYEKWPLNPS